MVGQDGWSIKTAGCIADDLEAKLIDALV